MTGLERVATAAEKAAEARLALKHAILDAREAGFPLRDIARAAGMSHEQVRRLTS